MSFDGSSSTLTPVVDGDIALSINTHCISEKTVNLLKWFICL